jgi:hypothetical protein
LLPTAKVSNKLANSQRLFLQQTGLFPDKVGVLEYSDMIARKMPIWGFHWRRGYFSLCGNTMYVLSMKGKVLRCYVLENATCKEGKPPLNALGKAVGRPTILLFDKPTDGKKIVPVGGGGEQRTAAGGEAAAESDASVPRDVAEEDEAGGGTTTAATTPSSGGDTGNDVDTNPVEMATTPWLKLKAGDPLEHLSWYSALRKMTGEYQAYGGHLHDANSSGATERCDVSPTSRASSSSMGDVGAGAVVTPRKQPMKQGNAKVGEQDLASSLPLLASPSSPMTLKRLASYDVIEEESLEARRQQEVQGLARELNLSVTEATTLLREKKWDREQLVRDYINKALSIPGPAGEQGGGGGGGGPSELAAEVFLEGNVPAATTTEKGPLPEEAAAAPAAATVPPSNECSICMGVSEENCSLACGHTFCKGCWGDFLTNALKSGAAELWGKGSTCPAQGCREPIPESFFEKVLPKDLYSKYRQYATNNFVDSNLNARWCPSATCNRALYIRNEAGATVGPMRDVKCACGVEFCFSCGQAPHSPATCAIATRWWEEQDDRRRSNAAKGTASATGGEPRPPPSAAGGSDDSPKKAAARRPTRRASDEDDGMVETLSGDEEENMRDVVWLAKNTRPCPKCKVPIQKFHGCNHMTCHNQRCQHEFCWVCLKDWKTHGVATGGYFNCTVNDPKVTRQKLKQLRFEQNDVQSSGKRSVMLRRLGDLALNARIARRMKQDLKQSGNVARAFDPHVRDVLIDAAYLLAKYHRFLRWVEIVVYVKSEMDEEEAEARKMTPGYKSRNTKGIRGQVLKSLAADVLRAKARIMEEKTLELWYLLEPIHRIFAPGEGKQGPKNALAMAGPSVRARVTTVQQACDRCEGAITECRAFAVLWQTTDEAKMKRIEAEKAAPALGATSAVALKRYESMKARLSEMGSQNPDNNSKTMKEIQLSVEILKEGFQTLLSMKRGGDEHTNGGDAKDGKDGAGSFDKEDWTCLLCHLKNKSSKHRYHCPGCLTKREPKELNDLIAAQLKNMNVTGGLPDLADRWSMVQLRHAQPATGRMDRLSEARRNRNRRLPRANSRRSYSEGNLTPEQESQVQTLEAMGFSNRRQTLRALQRSNGNINESVELLLRGT